MHCDGAQYAVRMRSISLLICPATGPPHFRAAHLNCASTFRSAFRSGRIWSNRSIAARNGSASGWIDIQFERTSLAISYTGLGIAAAYHSAPDRRLRHGTEQPRPLQVLRRPFMYQPRVTSAHAVHEPTMTESGVSHRPLRKVLTARTKASDADNR
jgi:hypothetical protein